MPLPFCVCPPLHLWLATVHGMGDTKATVDSRYRALIYRHELERVDQRIRHAEEMLDHLQRVEGRPADDLRVRECRMRLEKARATRVQLLEIADA